MSQQVRVIVYFRAYDDGWSWDDQISFDCSRDEILNTSLEGVCEWMGRRNRWFAHKFKSARVGNIAWRDDKGYWHDLPLQDQERWVYLKAGEAVK